ncbi:MAG: chromate transporter [Sulfolobales archaeon]|nr:chromate transporter [Sulfolobales archaeon]MDW8082401.1 chromate transporter [Sulfolobales archaeon]
MSSSDSVLLDLFVAFFKAGLILFGGGHTVIPILKQELVVYRGILTEKEFIDLVSTTEGLPGPITVKVAVLIGYRVAGFTGSTLAAVAIVLPTFVLTLTAAKLLYYYYQHPLTMSVLRGIRGAALGLLLSATLVFASGSLRELTSHQVVVTFILAIVSLLLITVLRVEILVVVGVAALVGFALGLAGFW